MFATATDGQKSEDFCILFHLISNSNLIFYFFQKCEEILMKIHDKKIIQLK